MQRMPTMSCRQRPDREQSIVSRRCSDADLASETSSMTYEFPSAQTYSAFSCHGRSHITACQRIDYDVDKHMETSHAPCDS